MRAWPWPPLLILLALSGYLLVRVEQLEARVDSVAKAAASTDEAEAGEETREELLDRVRSAEAEVATLRNQLSNLTNRVDPALENIEEGGDEARILDVVEQETNRIRDRQLDFHRERWLASREAALEQFAAQYHLTPWQVQQIQGYLTREIDHMVEILRSKESLENPEQAMSDWTTMLEETDRAVRGVLEEHQLAPWAEARAFERAVFMPWLPKAEAE